MAKTVLLAAQPEEAEVFCAVIQEDNHQLIVVDSLSEAKSHLDEMRFQIAVIDEDFDGPGTGWGLAESVRKYLASDVKIIVLVRGEYHEYFESTEFEGKFDWVMGFPISPEQLLHELNRKWPMD